MHFDTDGIYTLQYTAEDSCGNETVEERTVEVISYKTVLFTDGTLIINEKSIDRAANIALHGEVTNEYDPFDPNGDTDIKKYIFASASERPWHSQRNNVHSVEIGSNISPTSTAYWFNNLQTCTSIDVAKLDTSQVTNMQSMFASCYRLTALDVSHFNTENVTNMRSMFSGVSDLTSLDVSSFDTSNVTEMRSMFASCTMLTALDLSNFNTSKVTNMNTMITSCESLTTLDVSHFDTSNVTTMSNMFSGCKALTSLDLSSFDTSAVTVMGSMFQQCIALATIYASAQFVVSQVTSSASMFDSMSTNLVGGAGTVWSSSNPRDKTYAHIDGGTAAPGYFTAKP